MRPFKINTGLPFDKLRETLPSPFPGGSSSSTRLSSETTEEPARKDGLIKEAVKEKIRGSSTLHTADNFRKSVLQEVNRLGEIYGDDQRSYVEKLRGVLNFFVSPGIQVRYSNKVDEGPQALDLNLLPDTLPGDRDGVSIPLRMFDLDTGNMVETWALSDEDQYCMLSHSWKGNEVNYKYLCKAQRLEDEADANEEEDDATRVLRACTADLEKAERKLMQLRNTTDSSNIECLLSDFVNATKAEARYTRAKRRLFAAEAAQAQSKQETNQYGLLLAFMEEEVTLQSLKKRKQEADKRQNEASIESGAALNEHSRLEHKIIDIRKQRKLFYAIQDMLEALQRMRSARKLREAIKCARTIFDRKPFPKEGKRYIWLDNCCIDKTRESELTESLARMGEWYANADFCLVHLDTPKDDNDWLKEFKLWKSGGHMAEEITSKTSESLDDFNKIETWNPTWATRGWTLQELVLSKVTFYVNPNWDLLERPIDDLGQYYNLCPFIDLYTRNQEHATSKENISITMAALAAPDVQALLNGKRQQERARMIQGGDILESITDTLEALNFVVPKNLDEETARTRIGQCARSTIKSLQRLRLEHGGDTSIHPLKLYSLIAGTIHVTLRNSQPEGDGIYEERRIKIVIDLLLSALAKLKNHEIRADREHIARFSKVQCLKSWSRGTGRVNFSAHSVMNLASARECTVPTDIAYSLMGILGVRFPAFPAEGLTKALARLMDEVVIASNDVSVFNWSGKHNGSSIRGRSLYASNISGFRVENTEPQETLDADQELMRYFREQRTKDLWMAGRVNEILDFTTIYVKNLNQSNDTICALYDLVRLLKKHDFGTLRNSFDLKPIYDKMKAAKIAAKEEELEDGHQQPLIPGDSRDQQAPEEKHQERMQNNDPLDVQGTEKKQRWYGGRIPNQLSNLAPHANVRWRNEEKERAKQEKDAQNREKEAAEKRRLDRLRSLDEEVKKTVNLALSKRRESNIGQDSYDIMHTGGEDEDKVRVNKTETLESLDRRIISPNPIVLNSSGIKGVFDIQRIVVRMLDPDSLRHKIKTAISANEKIDGWCTISTGLALTMVAFSCERHVLAQQLDLVEVVEETVLKDPHAKLDGISEQLQKSEYRQNAPEANTESCTSSEEAIRQDLKKPERSSTSRSDLTTNQETMKIQYGNSPEQRKLFRMLEFVTESNIQIVAGEWVLARFSSAPGAKWFLCRLELGAGTEFYARRIPTDEIDFTEAFPERGLVEYWHAFLLEQKSIMCDVLSFYLDSKKAGNYTDWLGESIIKSLSGDVTSDQNEVDSCDDDVDLGGDLRSRDYRHLSNVRKMVKMIGWSTRGVFSETWASHLNRHLRDNALSKVPVHLRAAVEALSDRRVLLPLMFHTGKEIHFF